MERPDHISVSQVRTYQNCGLQYHFKYFEKIPIRTNDAMLRGSSIDKASNEHFETKAINDTGITENDFVDLAVSEHDTLADETEFDITKNESRDKTANASQKYHNIHGQNLIPSRENPTQIKIEEDMGNGQTFVGYVDLLTEDNRIVDTKVKARDIVNDVESDLQLNAYANFLNVDQVGIALVTTTKIPKAPFYPGKSSGKSKQIALKRIRSVSDAIDNNIFLPAAEGSWICSEKYCNYWNICDYGAKRK